MPWWWGAIAVVVIGAAVVWFGWRHDRRRAQAIAELATKPARAIPGLTAPDPVYVTEADLATADQAPTSPDADLIAAQASAATLPGGAAGPAFCPGRLTCLRAPDVLVLDADLDADRDVAAVLLAAKRRGAPLAVVAPGFSAVALGTLRANLLKGTATTLPITLADATDRRRAVALTGGRLVPAADLSSGWLPDEAWGSCDGWLADLDGSWVVVAGRDEDPRPPL